MFFLLTNGCNISLFLACLTIFDLCLQWEAEISKSFRFKLSESILRKYVYVLCVCTLVTHKKPIEIIRMCFGLICKLICISKITLQYIKELTLLLRELAKFNGGKLRILGSNQICESKLEAPIPFLSDPG